LTAPANDILFYDGTNIKRFTNLVDNPDYQVPAEGVWTGALKLFWFGERLVALYPTLGGTEYPQGILYSAIRNAGGNGDKFSTVGAGLLQANTSEYIVDAQMLGNTIIIIFNKSVWELSITTDPFNPFLIKRLRGAIGSEASFASVTWADEVETVGKKGVFANDGRESERVDDKIPYFTRDQIDPDFFNYTYGVIICILMQLENKPVVIACQCFK